MNENSKILNKDIELSNGIIHVINKVLDPSIMNIVQAIAKNDRYKIFTEDLFKTKLHEKLGKTYDDTYDPDNFSYIDVTWVQGGGSKDELPVSRKYGYTILVESDETLKNLYQINSVDDLAAYAAAHVYNEDPSDASVTDVTNPRNSLNKFIAYHIIEKKLTYSKFIDDYDTDHMLKTFDMYEYIETMCPNTLLEVKKERSSGQTNLLNKNSESGDVVRIVNDHKDIDAINVEWITTNMERFKLKAKHLSTYTGIDKSTLSILLNENRELTKWQKVAFY